MLQFKLLRLTKNVKNPLITKHKCAKIHTSLPKLTNTIDVNKIRRDKDDRGKFSASLNFKETQAAQNAKTASLTYISQRSSQGLADSTMSIDIGNTMRVKPQKRTNLFIEQLSAQNEREILLYNIPDTITVPDIVNDPIFCDLEQCRIKKDKYDIPFAILLFKSLDGLIKCKEHDVSHISKLAEFILPSDREDNALKVVKLKKISLAEKEKIDKDKRTVIVFGIKKDTTRDKITQYFEKEKQLLKKRKDINKLVLPKIRMELDKTRNTIAILEFKYAELANVFKNKIEKEKNGTYFQEFSNSIKVNTVRAGTVNEPKMQITYTDKQLRKHKKNLENTPKQIFEPQCERFIVNVVNLPESIKKEDLQMLDEVFYKEHGIVLKYVSVRKMTKNPESKMIANLEFRTKKEQLKCQEFDWTVFGNDVISTIKEETQHFNTQMPKSNKPAVFMFNLPKKTTAADLVERLKELTEKENSKWVDGNLNLSTINRGIKGTEYGLLEFKSAQCAAKCSELDWKSKYPDVFISSGQYLKKHKHKQNIENRKLKLKGFNIKDEQTNTNALIASHEEAREIKFYEPSHSVR